MAAVQFDAAPFEKKKRRAQQTESQCRKAASAIALNASGRSSK
jgi:hypothetical protein